MIARGFRPVAWVAAIGTAALGCYMLSLQVAAERAELAGLERQIVGTQQDIRSLQTELGTRGRLQQLEQWNAEVLALSAPVAGQFLESNVSLARFDVRQPTVADQGEVRLASAEPVPAPPAPTVTPPVRLASAEPVSAQAVAPTPTASAPAAVDAPARAPIVRRATLAAAPAQPRPTPLLEPATLRELRAESRSERDGGTRN